MCKVKLNDIPEFLQKSELYRSFIESNENLDIEVQYFLNSPVTINNKEMFILYLKLSDYWHTDEVLFKQIKHYIHYHRNEAIGTILDDDLILISNAAFECIQHILTLKIDTDTLYLIYLLYLKYNLPFRNTTFIYKMIESNGVLSHIFMKSYLLGTIYKNKIIDFVVYCKKFDKITKHFLIKESGSISNEILSIYSNIEIDDSLRKSQKFLKIMKELCSDNEFDPNIMINGETLFEIILFNAFNNADEGHKAFKWFTGDWITEMLTYIFSLNIKPIKYYSFIFNLIIKNIIIRKIRGSDNFDRTEFIYNLNRVSFIISTILKCDPNFEEYLNKKYDWDLIEPKKPDMMVDTIYDVKTWTSVLKFFVNNYSQ